MDNHVRQRLSASNIDKSDYPADIATDLHLIGGAVRGDGLTSVCRAPLNTWH
jgi:hypothetical protein